MAFVRMRSVSEKAGQIGLENLQVATTEGLIWTGITEEREIRQIEAERPKTAMLWPNYPNPFNPSTTLRFSIPIKSHVSLVIYDVLGHRVKRLVYDRMDPGIYAVLWNGKDDQGRRVGSGVYLCRARIGDFVTSRKLVLIK